MHKVGGNYCKTAKYFVSLQCVRESTRRMWRDGDRESAKPRERWQKQDSEKIKEEIKMIMTLRSLKS